MHQLASWSEKNSQNFANTQFRIQDHTNNSLSVLHKVSFFSQLTFFSLPPPPHSSFRAICLFLSLLLDLLISSPAVSIRAISSSPRHLALSPSSLPYSADSIIHTGLSTSWFGLIQLRLLNHTEDSFSGHFSLPLTYREITCEWNNFAIVESRVIRGESQIRVIILL